MSVQRRTFSKKDKLKILKEVKEHGVKITLDKHGLYPATYYSWKRKYEEIVEEKAMVRVIDTFGDMLDLASFNFTYFELNQQGRPPFHPSTMLKIYFYGYQNGIRSCRQLEKACKTNIEMMWLIHEQRPHFKTIANFSDGVSP